MSCGISIEGYDGDAPEKLAVFEGPAIAAFKCEECGREFPAGTTREKAVAIWEEGDPEVTIETCMDCTEIAHAFADGGRYVGTLWESLEGDGATDEDAGLQGFNSGCLLKLGRASAKELLVERWQRWKGLQMVPKGESV